MEGLHHDGLDRLTSRGELGQRGDVQVAEDRHRHGARDRRRRHHQDVRRGLGLGGDRGSLLDAEAVLLVDDDQPEIGGLHLLLQQRVGADDDAGLSRGDVEQRRAPRSGGHGAGDEREPRGLARSAQAAGLDEVAEHRPQRPRVLLREHLGRRQEHGLAAGVDDLQHRAHRDQRLAGADLALEQPVHGRGGGELLGDLLADLLLSCGQGEGQPGVERGQQPLPRLPARMPRPGCGIAGGAGAAALHQQRLRHQRLVERETGARRALLRPVLAAVDPVHRLVAGDEPQLGPDLLRQRVGRLVEDRQGERDRAHQLGVLESAGELVDGPQVGIVGAVALGVQAGRLAGLVQRLEDGVGQLPDVVEELDLALHEPGLGLLQHVAAPLGAALDRVEEGDLQPAAGRLDEGLDPVGDAAAPTVVELLHLRLHHASHEGDEVALAQGVQIGDVALADVRPRIVGQQVADGAPAVRLAELRRRLGGDAVEAGVQGDAVDHLTRPPPAAGSEAARRRTRRRRRQCGASPRARRTSRRARRRRRRRPGSRARRRRR